MQTDSLGHLVKLAQKGDRLAFNELIMRCQRRVFAAALAVAGDMDEADDIAQEAFVRLFDKISTIEDPDAVCGWLMRASVNIARDRQRFKRIRAWFGKSRVSDKDQADSTYSPDILAARNEMQRLILAWAEARLSEKERLVLQLRAGEEMKIEEISKELGMKSSTVKTHLARAREKLKPLRKKFGGG